jgi:putative ABC transport system permease protein
MGVYFIMALRNLLQARRRTLLLTGALCFVSLFLVLLLALSQGITDTMIRSSTILYTGHVNVAGWYKAKSTDAIPLVKNTDELRTMVEENTPGLAYVIDRMRGWAKLVSPTSSMYASLSGIEVAEEQEFIKQVQLAPESDYKEEGRPVIEGRIEDLAEANSIVIFAAQAKRLGVGVGDELTLSAETNTGITNTMDVRVVAVAKDIGFMSNWNAYLSKSAIRAMYDLADDTSGVVLVYLDDPNRAAEVMEHLRGVFADKGFELLDHQPDPFWMKFEVISGEDWVGEKLDLTTWKDETGMMNWAIQALKSISFFLVIIMLFIIVVGIVNTMFIAVRERTREIGTLRAIGMRRGQVLRVFLLEAALLGAGATTLGVCLGAMLAVVLNALSVSLNVDALRAILMSDTLHLSVQPSQMLGAIIVFTLVTALAALWPAIRAARLVPVTAIHRAE